MRQWLTSRWTRVALGLLAGGIVGLAVYGAGRLTGPGLVLQFYSRSVRLTDITITIPQFSELHFAVTRDRQLSADTNDNLSHRLRAARE